MVLVAMGIGLVLGLIIDARAPSPV